MTFEDNIPKRSLNFFHDEDYNIHEWKAGDFLRFKTYKKGSYTNTIFMNLTDEAEYLVFLEDWAEIQQKLETDELLKAGNEMKQYINLFLAKYESWKLKYGEEE